MNGFIILGWFFLILQFATLTAQFADPKPHLGYFVANAVLTVIVLACLVCGIMEMCR